MLRLGLAFLTRWPPPPEVAPAERMARATRVFPLAGALVAGVSLGAATAGSWGWTPAAGAVAAVAAEAWVTRGLHLDGLADCFDGLLVPGDRERRLVVMHDPRVGALAAASLVLWLAARIVLVAAAAQAGTLLAAAWAAALLSRAPLAAELRLPAATPGRGLAGGIGALVRPADAGVSGVLAGALLLPVAWAGPGTLGLATLAALAVSLAWHRLWRSRIGGVNGDVLGGAVELRTLAVYAVYASPWVAAWERG